MCTTQDWHQSYMCAVCTIQDWHRYASYDHKYNTHETKHQNTAGQTDRQAAILVMNDRNLYLEGDLAVEKINVLGDVQFILPTVSHKIGV